MRAKFYLVTLVLTMIFSTYTISQAEETNHQEGVNFSVEDSCVKEEAVNSNAKVGGSGIGYKEEFLSKKIKKHNAFLTWHPDFPYFQRNINGYIFLKTKASMNISVGGNIVGISYAPAGQGTGTYISSDPTRASRPAIYGDIFVYKYKVGQYNFNTKTWLHSSVIERTKIAEPTMIRIEYK